MSTDLVATNSQLDAFIRNTEPLDADGANLGANLFLKCDTVRRQLFLAMFERGAHTATGLNWEEFCAKKLHMSDNSYGKNLLRWARVERNILTVNETSSLKKLAVGYLSRAAAMELAKLPDEYQRKAYNEAQQYSDYAKQTPAEFAKSLKIIAGRIAEELKAPTTLALDEPDAEPEPETEDEPEPPSIFAGPEEEEGPDPFEPDQWPEEPEGDGEPPEGAPEVEIIPPVVKPKPAKYCECTFEKRYVRVELETPDGAQYYVLVPKSALGV